MLLLSSSNLRVKIDSHLCWQVLYWYRYKINIFLKNVLKNNYANNIFIIIDRDACGENYTNESVYHTALGTTTSTLYQMMVYEHNASKNGLVNIFFHYLLILLLAFDYVSATIILVLYNVQ